MRNLVEPPPSRCRLCNGELRLKLVEHSGASTDIDSELFVCANCGHEQAYKGVHDPYTAHIPDKKPPAKAE
jgi:uncharacterized protein with PIN domain